MVRDALVKEGKMDVGSMFHGGSLESGFCLMVSEVRRIKDFL